MRAWSACSIRHYSATDAENVRFALSKLMSGRQVSPFGGDSPIYIPRRQLNLDPMAAAVSLGSSPDQVLAIVNAMAERERRLGQTVDEGSLVLDQLLGTNMSGARKPPFTRVALSDDATYKVQAKGSTGYTGPSTDLEFIRLANTPMMDWDKPDQYHRDANVTVRNLADVEGMAQEYVKAHPESMLKLYLTPGGYRAWEMGETMTPSEFKPRFEELNVDPGYAFLSSAPYDGDPAGFASRISAKPGRVDWAAQPLTTIKGEQAIPSMRSLQLVETLHDKPIGTAYLTDGYGANKDAMTALQKELPGVSATLAAELRRRFHL